jgi:hypothetical protein
MGPAGLTKAKNSKYEVGCFQYVAKIQEYSAREKRRAQE